MPRRTPRWPSIGLNSCSCSTRCSSVFFSSSSAPVTPVASSFAISTIRSSRFGRNSWSGGSIVRMVTGVALHRLEHAVEVGALQRQQLVQRGPAIGLVVGQDHPLHLLDAALAEEHVLGAAQPDAARAERVGELGLVRQIGVGADAERPLLVGPREQLAEALVDVRLLGLHLAREHLQDLARLGRDLADLDLAGQAVERHPVALA